MKFEWRQLDYSGGNSGDRSLRFYGDISSGLEFEIRLHANNIYACIERAFNVMPCLRVGIVDAGIIYLNIAVG